MFILIHKNIARYKYFNAVNISKELRMPALYKSAPAMGADFS